MKHIRRYGLFAFSCALVGLFLCLAVVVIAQGEADSDLDGMPDWYESFFGLNPTNAADAAFNYDSDSLTNAAEFAKYTDPFAGDTDRDGFKDDYDQSPVSRGYLNFGNPKFTTNNSYWYVFPAWLESVSKTDGEWVTNAVPDGDATAWHVPASESNDVGALSITVNRNILSNDAVLDMLYYDADGASLYVNLVNSNQVYLATNLFGNLMKGSNAVAFQRLSIPFESYPEANGLEMARGAGAVTIYEGLIYVDVDGDFFDADQEIQANTSDQDTDSDDDGLNDYYEAVTLGTDPANPDSDNDGLSDGHELAYGTDPLDADTDDDGMPDGWEVAHGLNPLVNDAGLDPDSDGLTNLQEYQNGTDPQDADTDNDGMPDGWEVANGLNPLVNDAGLDPDNDELTNLQEYQYGTNPLNPDTDGDGMPDGWEVAHGFDPTSIPTEAIVGWWQFNETNGAVAFDSSGYENSGDIFGADRVPGRLLNGLEFSGADDYVVVSNSAVYKPTQLTIGLWVKIREPDAVTNGVSVMLAQANAGSGHAYALYMTARQSLVFQIENSAENNMARLETADIFCVTGQWYHLVGTYDGTNAAFYVNSVKIGTLAYTSALEYAAGSGLVFGGERTGALDEALVLNRALSAAEIAEMDEWLADDDGDGINNLDEYENGTNPNGSDSDNDSMPDDWELDHGLNSLVDDTALDPDNDGLTNLQEYQNGTDPQDADTDNDGMPDGWEVAHGLYPLILDAGLDPDNDGLTNLQEYQNGTDPHDADTDDDGMPDGWEVAHGLNPLLNDTGLDPDSDGLTNLQEYQNGTDPQDADTDNDGMPDGWEVEHGFNPTSVPTGSAVGWWKLNETNDSVAADSSGFGNHGVVYGAEHAPAQLNYGLNLDGADDYVVMSNSAAYKPEHLTIGVRMKAAEPLGAESDNMTILEQRNMAWGGGAGSYAYAFYKTDRHSLLFELSNSSQTNTMTIETSDLFWLPGNWYHLVGTYDGTNAAFYVNGTMVGSAPHSSPLEYSASSGLALGWEPPALAGYYKGALDDVLVLNAALTSNQVADLEVSTADYDGDGRNNAQEYEDGTDPFEFEDLQPPSVIITHPVSGSAWMTTNAAMTLSGVAADNFTVASVAWSSDQGGSGTCQGTTNWSKSGIALEMGENLIKAIAFDGYGNSATDTLTVTRATHIDVVDPTVSITSPTADPTLQTSASSISLGGTAWDDFGVTQVHWSNDRGGSGNCAGFPAGPGSANWSAGAVWIAEGTNVITVTAYDELGHTATDTLTVTRPDVTPPTIAITSPTSGAIWQTANQTLSLSGTAYDEVGVTEVTWVNSKGGSGSCSGFPAGHGTASWSIPTVALDFSTGANVVTIKARDAAGHSAFVMLTVTPIDAAAPMVTISHPTSSSNFVTAVETLNVSGSVTDDVGVTSMIIENDRYSGASISVQYGPEEYDWGKDISLAYGTNILTVTTYDASGYKATAALIVTRLAEDGSVKTNLPAVSITNMLAPYYFTDPSGNHPFRANTGTNGIPYGLWVDGPLNPYWSVSKSKVGSTYLTTNMIRAVIPCSENYRLQIPTNGLVGGDVGNWLLDQRLGYYHGFDGIYAPAMPGYTGPDWTGSQGLNSMCGMVFPSPRRTNWWDFDNRYWIFGNFSVNQGTNPGVVFGFCHQESYAPIPNGPSPTLPATVETANVPGFQNKSPNPNIYQDLYGQISFGHIWMGSLNLLCSSDGGFRYQHYLNGANNIDQRVILKPPDPPSDPNSFSFLQPFYGFFHPVNPVIETSTNGNAYIYVFSSHISREVTNMRPVTNIVTNSNGQVLSTTTSLVWDTMSVGPVLSRIAFTNLYNANYNRGLWELVTVHGPEGMSEGAG